MPLELAITGTDTGVGKTKVTRLIVQGLRALGRRVWVHKPVACGGWDGCSSEDGRALREVIGDDQPFGSVCPHEFPEPASPHLAAAADGWRLHTPVLRGTIASLRRGQDLIVEGAGGLLTPMTDDRTTLMDLCDLPLLIVTRPHLGTLNHTALTARVAGDRAIGLILNHHEALPDSVATRHAAEELVAVTGLPLLVEIPFGGGEDPGDAQAVAEVVLAAFSARRDRISQSTSPAPV